MQGKGKLAFPSTILKLCKDAEVPMREFERTELIPQDKLITARLVETTRLEKNVQVQQQNEEEEDQPMPQFEEGNEEDHDQGQHQHFEPQYQQPKAEIKKQLKEWTRNASSRDAYCCWAHQQANPNLTEIPIHQIIDLIQANAEKGRHIFYGGLKSHLVAGSSSQATPSQATPPQPADEPMTDPNN
ncbi:hypothetical protein PIB30_084723 [Stylosanthes scabra]|uniref:Uncharacterized protein n=1 Tax=Stylosanthes scabra TaxID=79078 RepID=A0ABU6QT57_9FABA|nr:hypothetical protein [Stylosanthes scabra]